MERIDNTIEAYYTFVDSYKDSEYIKDAQTIFTKATEMKNDFKLKNS